MDRRHTKAIILATAAALLIAATDARAGEPEAASAKTAATRKQARIARLEELTSREPSIREVQQAALAHYQLEPERIRGMTSLARVKGLVPEIDAGVDSTLGHNYLNTQDALYPSFPYKERQAGSSDQTVWHVRGVWDLSRVVFNPEQLDIRTLGSLQETLIREVTTTYFSRRRVLANLVLSPPDDEEELYFDQLRLDEMTATLDSFTGGKFAERAVRGDEAR
jgi:hypothetical protein